MQALTLGKEPTTPLIYSVRIESMLKGLDFLTSGIHILLVGILRRYVFLIATAAAILCVHSHKGPQLFYWPT